MSTTVNGVTRNQVTDNTFDFFDLGYFETEEAITINLNFPGNKAISFDKPSFYALDTQNYKIAMDTINERDTKVTTSKIKYLLIIVATQMLHYFSPFHTTRGGQQQ